MFVPEAPNMTVIYNLHLCSTQTKWYSHTGFRRHSSKLSHLIFYHQRTRVPQVLLNIDNLRSCDLLTCFLQESNRNSTTYNLSKYPYRAKAITPLPTICRFWMLFPYLNSEQKDTILMGYKSFSPHHVSYTLYSFHDWIPLAIDGFRFLLSLLEVIIIAIWLLQPHCFL